tara:strand:+ start:705 stop:1751 length:1047 start_codon:yes stop_codon:yes gene_type:complete
MAGLLDILMTGQGAGRGSLLDSMLTLTPEQRETMTRRKIGDFGASVLAQSGWSKYPQTMGEIVGKAYPSMQAAGDKSLQEILIGSQVKKNIAAGKASDLIDAQGNIKTETTQAVRSTAATALGGYRDPVTGEYVGLGKNKAKFLATAQKAEELILGGEKSIANAVYEARKILDPIRDDGTKDGEVAVPEITVEFGIKDKVTEKAKDAFSAISEQISSIKKEDLWDPENNKGHKILENTFNTLKDFPYGEVATKIKEDFKSGELFKKEKIAPLIGEEKSEKIEVIKSDGKTDNAIMLETITDVSKIGDPQYEKELQEKLVDGQLYELSNGNQIYWSAEQGRFTYENPKK